MGLGKSLKKIGHHAKKACGKVSNPFKKSIKKTGLAKYSKKLSTIFSGKLCKNYINNYLKNSIGEKLLSGKSSNTNFVNKYYNENFMNKLFTYA